MAATRTGMATRGMSLEDRFMAHVIKEEDECWTWTSNHDYHGTPRFKMKDGTPDGKMMRAHHASILIFREESIPTGDEGHHVCLNHGCVNPDHIQVLTKTEHQAEHRRLKAEAAASV